MSPIRNMSPVRKNIDSNDIDLLTYRELSWTNIGWVLTKGHPKSLGPNMTDS